MAEDKRVGPCHVFLGDPTTAAGADMQYQGHTRGDVTVSLNVGVAFGRVDQKGRVPLADAVFATGSAPVASVPLVDEEKEKLVNQILGAVLTESGGAKALGFGDEVKQIAVGDIPTLALIPVDEVDQGTNGIDAEHAIWLPACVVGTFGDLMFNLPEGDDVLNPHEAQFTSLHRETDQDDTAIPVGHRNGFYGAPAALGLTWFLPTATP